MNETKETKTLPETVASFFKRPHVRNEVIPIAGGIPLGIERVFNSEIGLGGAYGAWGDSYDNARLPTIIEHRLGEPMSADDNLALDQLGFVGRHHTPDLSDADHLELEIEVRSTPAA